MMWGCPLLHAVDANNACMRDGVDIQRASREEYSCVLIILSQLYREWRCDNVYDVSRALLPWLLMYNGYLAEL